MKKYISIFIVIVVTFITGAVVKTTFAGSLTPTASPASAMYTLEDIYSKLVDNTETATEGLQSFTTPTSVATTFRTLKEIYESIPTLDATKIAVGTTYMGVDGTLVAGSSAGLLKTGQALCYDPSGVTTGTVSCASTGQDGDIQAGVAVYSYTDNGDNTITDNRTGLIWQKTDAGTINFAAALSYCNANTPALPGSGWRVPNIRELGSIADYSATPLLSATYFPGATISSFWSSTSVVNALNRGYTFHFGSGLVAQVAKSGTAMVKCVRG